jgi:isoaspartyl peptidase/L-asparaginase-like protein (Ntn-hydrolase superfamily)
MPDRQRAFRDGIESALRAGFVILERGGSSLDAVVAAVQVLEDDPLFNAGRGSVLAANGEQGLEPVPNDHFTTERRRLELERVLRGQDKTGGMTGKKCGRIGDSPIIGAETYAANDCCAVSGTGHREYFIRAAVAHEIASLMRYRGMDVTQAADEVVMRQLLKIRDILGFLHFRQETENVPYFRKRRMSPIFRCGRRGAASRE